MLARLRQWLRLRALDRASARCSALANASAAAYARGDFAAYDRLITLYFSAAGKRSALLATVLVSPNHQKVNP